MTIGSLSLWALRDEILLWQSHFTWVAVRYAIVFNRLPAFGLAFCIGLTVATLISHSHHLCDHHGRSTRR
jgi:hypothetical protein